MMGSFPYVDSFVSAGPRKNRRRRLPPPSPRVQLDRATTELLAGNWFDKSYQQLLLSLNDLKFPASINSVQVLCLGLGSPVLHRDSRAQLAFLLQLCAALNINLRRVSVYDPEFTDEDVNLLTDLQLSCLTENKHGMYPLDTQTIVFMPHCTDVLNESLLRSNWSRDRLNKLILIGNDFAEFTALQSTRVLQSNYPCLLKLAPFLISHPLGESPAFKTAFHGISTQHVSLALPGTHDTLFWEMPTGSVNPICC